MFISSHMETPQVPWLGERGARGAGLLVFKKCFKGGHKGPQLFKFQ